MPYAYYTIVLRKKKGASMKAKKLPSGRWRAQAYLGTVDGKKKFKSFTADTKKEAEFLASDYLYNRDKYASADCFVADAIDRYITTRESVLSPSTLREYRRSQKHDFDLVGDYSISALTSDVVQAFINALSASKSPKTVKNIYGLFISSVRAVNPSANFRITLPQPQPREYSIPTDEDVRRLLELADPVLKKAILLASAGTLRRGEIAALDYSDIEGDAVHVHADVVKDIHGKWVLKSVPKTSESDRYVSFSPAVMERLGTGTGRIVPLNPRQITARFQTIRKKLGLSCRFHDLRHYSASIMHALGIPDQYIMARGGWSSDATLKAVYRNVLEDKDREFADRVNGHLDGLL